MFQRLSHSIVIAGLSVIAAAVTVTVSTPALAGTDQPRSAAVRFGDLDLASDKGTDELNQRIRRASRKVCSTGGKGVAQLRAEAECRAQAVARAQPEVELAVAAARGGRGYAANTFAVDGGW